MVADTDSSLGQLVVPIWCGALVGAVAGAGLTLAAGIPLGSAIPSLLGCTVLGIFFALCQNRTTLLGYLLVGFFFGINCWILTKLLIALHMDTTWPMAREHVTSFKHCILFGEILGITALLLSSMQSDASEATLPKD